jgi:hypothetical protein
MTTAVPEVTEVLDWPKTEGITTDNGDHERFTHVVVPKDAVTRSYITGEPVTSLCGKTWVPSRDPQKFPVCPECKEIMKSIGVDL